MALQLSELNPQQREAVEYGSGPLLILAGAGSGKTRVITHRIAHLIAARAVPPHAILAMTFTNKAAEEMQKRVTDLLPSRYGSSPLITTFHSFCVRSLRRDYEAIAGRRDFVIYDEDDQLAVVKALVKQLGLDDKQFTPRTVLSRISAAKNRGWSPVTFRENANDPRSERVAVVYDQYQKILRRSNALDFDDLLLETERLLRESPQTTERYNDRFRYLLIDEYQDTNRPQYHLMRLLTQAKDNVCAVGDEDQSIYSWRGADIRNILDFEKDFANLKIIRLEQNYRSTKNILEAASAVVANNIERKGKTLWTDAGAGELIGYYEAPEGENEALWVADQSRALLRHNPEAKVAVLYRMNSQSRLFEEAMRRYGQKYRVLGGFSFYERAEIKDLLAYLKVALNPEDSISLLRIINTPARGIGKTTVDSLERLALEQNTSVFNAIGYALDSGSDLTTRATSALREFRQLVIDLRDLNSSKASVHDVLKLAVDRTGYIRLLEQEDTPEALSRVENIFELMNAATDAAERGEPVSEFLDHAALVSDQDDYDASAALTLMTLHAAKGLEFDYVFLVGMEEGAFPHSRASNTTRELEEERRLCYVGITRARRRLYFTHAKYRRRYGSGMPEPTMPSRFLAEIPQSLLADLSERRDSGLRYVAEGYSQDLPRAGGRILAGKSTNSSSQRPGYNSVDNIASFFRKRQPSENQSPAPSPKRAAERTDRMLTGGTKLSIPPRAANASGAFRAKPAEGARGLRLGSRVKHPRFGTGTVLRIEGMGDDTKLTVSFPGYGLKKMIEKFAGLEPL